MEKQLLAYVHASRSFTSHLGKTSDVQIMNQLLIYVQYFLLKEDCMMNFCSVKIHAVREEFLVWLMIINCEP